MGDQAIFYSSIWPNTNTILTLSTTIFKY